MRTAGRAESPLHDSDRTRHWLRAFAFVVPAAYCALTVILAPADRLGAPAALNRTVNPGFSTKRLLYDDYDVTAMALRGLNVADGRIPSRQDAPECLNEEFRPHPGGEPQALSPSFFAEYPHAALWLFRLAFPSSETVRSWRVPDAVLDSCYSDLVTYSPATSDEKYLWHKLRRATNLYRVAATVCLMLMVLVLQFGFGARRPQPATALLILPAALYFAVNRFDVLPALLMAVSLTCLARRRDSVSGIALGLATAVKVFPFLLAPFIVRWLWPAPKRVAHWVGGFAAALIAIVGCAWITYGIEGLVAPYAYQVQRPPELMWIYYGHILPYSWALDPMRAGVFRIGSLCATITVLLLPSIRELDQLLRRGLIVLVTFTSLQVFWSPQWLLWLHPLLIPLVPGQRILGWLLAAFDLTMFVSFPLVYDAGELPGRDQWIHGLVWLRAACSAVLVAVLGYREVQTTFADWFARRRASKRA